MTKSGYLALVLHAHLPYVHHPESPDYLEERWLHEAITETYIPLLQVFQGLVHDQVDFHLTLSLTPTLLSMLTNPLLQSRYVTHIDGLIELAEKEISRTEAEPEFHELAKYYFKQFTQVRDFFLRYDQNLVHAFRELQEAGYLEIITCAATHAFLPLVQNSEAVRAQILTAIDCHEAHLGVRPKGIWLPECGYYPGVEKILYEAGIQYFVTDTHGLTSAQPAPVFGTLSPILTPAGVAAFARDEDSGKQVWSANDGYPGDVHYREYYRDIGYDLDHDWVAPYIHPTGIRVNTGLKYFRITGESSQKQPYQLAMARQKAADHAADFLGKRQQQVISTGNEMGRSPLIVAPYDAELFGHWWYEGPVWLDVLLRQIHFDQTILKTITPSSYLHLYSDYQVCELHHSSWGRDGFADVWLGPNNHWIYPALHDCEQKMMELANRSVDCDTQTKRMLNQAARELMLAQSSDFAFMMDGQTMVEYAVKRTKNHVNRFHHLYAMIQGQLPFDEEWLATVEQRDALFPAMDYTVYQSANLLQSADSKLSTIPERRRVLLLSWEFPPMNVGGLSSHVYDLARYLVKAGWDVHVLTTGIGHCLADERVKGIQVHRVWVPKPDGGEFQHWAFQLNLAMIEVCTGWMRAGWSVDLVHAHDWLVCYAAQVLKTEYQLPLVATIHATEHGRNHGIRTDEQKYIHHLEWCLTYEASHVIVCSSYMWEEVHSIFQLPSDKLSVIPNGVDVAMLQTNQGIVSSMAKMPASEKVVLFLGRMVYEKGVQTLIEAVPEILFHSPDTRFVLIGRGSLLPELQDKVERLGIQDKVLFTGYVSDEERNEWLQKADVAVFPSLYEPFGIVALEAMAVHTPVVVSDVGGLADVVTHNHNGLKMYPGDAHSLAAQVERLLNHPEWAQALADVAKRELANYDWQKIAEQTVDVYTRAIR